MSSAKKLLEAAAGTAAAGGAGLDIAEVFSTYLYNGTGSAQTITNGIDLNGEGGLVWVKSRNYTYGHALSDTEHTVGNYMSSDTTDPIQGGTNAISAFNSNGFSLGNDAYLNGSGSNLASWTWRKAKKYFDVVTWTGNSTNRQIAHSLNSPVGMILAKCTSNGSTNWQVFHRASNASSPGNYRLELNQNGAAQANSQIWNNTAPTTTEFTVGIGADINKTGRTYVAYLFAHNDGDGGFGPDGDQDIISCSSYTGNGSSTGPVINLGWEPQWIMIKNATVGGTSKNWFMLDSMRGIPESGEANAAYLGANTNSDEEYAGIARLSATGFQLRTASANLNGSGNSYIYMAIRAPMMKEPEAAIDVFAVAPRSSTSGYDYAFVSNFPVDFGMSRTVLAAAETRIGSRLTGDNYLQATNNQAEAAGSDWYQGDSMNSVGLGFSKRTESPNEKYAWMWKRAKGYADVVCYTGNSTAGRTVAHSLGVVPEMMWVKQRPYASDWRVYHSALGNVQALTLNRDVAAYNLTSAWNSTTPTASVFTLGSSNDVNENPLGHIAYLFATLDGISKVGSYTGTGADLVVNCGFTSGARFVLIKRTDGSGPWLLFDVLRGITTASTDGIIKLNVTDASETEAYYGGANMIEPSSNGFKLTSDGELNTNGQTYIFYAIA